MIADEVVFMLLFQATIAILAISDIKLCQAAKVLEIGDQLPRLLDEHPDRSWLIKFYAPWCHHCQQLETTFNNVAERIYHKHDHLIVGRVDCSKFGNICKQYQIESYPTLMFMKKDDRVLYRGDRIEDSIISFAERMSGPTINSVARCDQLKSALSEHEIIALSTIRKDLNLQTAFEKIAHSQKSNYWFYELSSQPTPKCNSFNLTEESIFIIKSNSNKAIRFDASQAAEDESSQEELTKTLLKWINKNLFPVVVQITSRNIERSVSSGKFMILAILDEHKPARKVTPTSRKFFQAFKKLAIDYEHRNEVIGNNLLFGWTSELDLIEYITLSPVKVLPNVIMLNERYAYHLIVQDASQTSTTDGIPVGLSESSLTTLITKLEKEELILSGGDTYSHLFLRHTLGNFNKFLSVYKANPLLVSLIFGFPGLIFIFVIYTTCYYEEDYDKSRSYNNNNLDVDDEESSGSEGDESRRLISNGHLKQE